MLFAYVVRPFQGRLFSRHCLYQHHPVSGSDGRFHGAAIGIKEPAFFNAEEKKRRQKSEENDVFNNFFKHRLHLCVIGITILNTYQIIIT
jgi:hypothetical protein